MTEKTFDQPELLGQELLLLALNKWADLIRPELPVSFTLLRVLNRNKGLDWNQNVTNWIRYSGKITVGNVELHFKCVFNRGHLRLQERWSKESFSWHNNIDDKWKKPFSLTFEEKDDEGNRIKDITADIYAVNFEYRKSSRGWEVDELEVDHDDEILIAIRKRLKV
jgi:hypothetical protein